MQAVEAETQMFAEGELTRTLCFSPRAGKTQGFLSSKLFQCSRVIRKKYPNTRTIAKKYL